MKGNLHIFVTLFSLLQTCSARSNALPPTAIVRIVPGLSSNVDGELVVKATANGVIVKGVIRGLSPGRHGFHVHEKPDLGNDCKNAGGHFNPANYVHGDPRDLKRHIGDFGNIAADENGVANVYIIDFQASMDPSSEAYIGNLSFVVHAGEDDLGRGNNTESLKTGNAGARAGCGLIEVQQQTQQHQAKTCFAAVKMSPGSTPGLTGELIIKPTQTGIFLEGQIRGLSPGLHGFHIHEIGDLGNDCLNAGGHFNPYGKNHGAPNDTERHVGDLGNIEADETGTANIRIFDSVASMIPSSESYIGNLSVVVHVGVDDLGKGDNPDSLQTGNAGARGGCGIIKVEGDGQPIMFPEGSSRFKNVKKSLHATSKNCLPTCQSPFCV